ncbi:hypothetical protein EJ05DRAFT_9772 [Pseudovirgaria hyperparasitica]|uniref:Uncharacterized protein n=1 Tax=Pseudovirgaria hyperparasitica TaxID=470096 RepID=A0A6A6WKL0_9PEZI|nr:uncharacterized protein EJ05DRAFT_9772 [Pseudovirgaria hyperparasitica]KAF2762691.1 hypothetical protein EJ05DRAFT_9772 [Pseudovirgaria hyperparasitica]
MLCPFPAASKPHHDTVDGMVQSVPRSSSSRTAGLRRGVIPSTRASGARVPLKCRADRPTMRSMSWWRRRRYRVYARVCTCVCVCVLTFSEERQTENPIHLVLDPSPSQETNTHMIRGLSPPRARGLVQMNKKRPGSNEEAQHQESFVIIVAFVEKIPKPRPVRSIFPA